MTKNILAMAVICGIIAKILSNLGANESTLFLVASVILLVVFLLTDKTIREYL